MLIQCNSDKQLNYLLNKAGFCKRVLITSRGCNKTVQITPDVDPDRKALTVEF